MEIKVIIIIAKANFIIGANISPVNNVPLVHLPLERVPLAKDIKFKSSSLPNLFIKKYTCEINVKNIAL